MRRLAVLALLSLDLATAPFAWAAEPIQREQTASGLTILVRENRTVPVVAASVMVRVGTRWEREDNTGITNLLQHVLVKGTQSRTALRARPISGLVKRIARTWPTLSYIR